MRLVSIAQWPNKDQDLPGTSRRSIWAAPSHDYPIVGVGPVSRSALAFCEQCLHRRKPLSTRFRAESEVGMMPHRHDTRMTGFTGKAA
jgi:hypothetical protein